MTNIVGVIFLGGKSTRMGTPKHQLQLPNGKTMLQQTFDSLREVCAEIVFSVPPNGMTGLNEYSTIRQLKDRRLDFGPLAGLDACLSSQIADAYLVVACDQPLTPPSLYCRLLNEDISQIQCFRRSPHGIYPFPALYPSFLEAVVQTLLQEDNHRMQDLFERSPYHSIALSPEEETFLLNINTPEQLDAIRLYFS